MPESDKPPFGGHEPPPPPAAPPPAALKIVAGLALAFDLVTVIALLADRCDLATILAILALLFGGATFAMVARMGSDKPPFGGHEPPPRG
ncbi:MAG: hypothetical protein QOH06_5024 [Acidobacteriota bacterium]|jgi:hypothetical protein|nr:hypothetical protein [Acidobacteriota bacterium]